eukprot:tig00000042_g15622.t1
MGSQGKSTLLEAARREAAGLGLAVASAAGLESRARQPLYVWRAVLKALFPGGQAEVSLSFSICLLLGYKV